MIQLQAQRIAIAILRNQAHRLLGGIRRGGHRTATWSADERRAHGERIHQALAPYLGDVAGQTGLEIGPGDNLEVCRQFLDAGCERMLAVERYARPPDDDGRVALLRSPIEQMALHEEVDFAYSNDVFEHVANVPSAMRAIYQALKPGGRLVCSIDLRGHNVFNLPDRPLDFLTCPDWLWQLMFSHVATTNRVRPHEFLEAAVDAGFEVKEVVALARADPAYVAQIRPHLLKRYQQLPDSELSILQYLLVLVRPAALRQHEPAGVAA